MSHYPVCNVDLVTNVVSAQEILDSNIPMNPPLSQESIFCDVMNIDSVGPNITKRKNEKLPLVLAH
ncbi:hypothetical protein BDP27DRAFT_1415802 [Rhodocollybia butyracea]|uniref:Uncharacterized protein n=1 Tax=Rhodocollybia butyracea TaxID=206335 RepID=A0A9P5UE39_9AGAR|nr:hypothetical protein BDP27DRAFT_1415802 [Rhodocollybia butyracea]